ncbi:acyl transferase [Maribacter aestuarii]|uniref:LuxE/PaaK family acyltransferase n=1 Tax=Maribacter aestuarii TaxID=1130723 RepID=UPI00248B7B67|nr:acyl transferase [Maribacter aestuarii]
MDYQRIFNIKTDAEFLSVTLDIFGHQYRTNSIYKEFCDYFGANPNNVLSLETLPFIPIQFFKSREILSDSDEPEMVFTSSGTTGATTSSHFITDVSIYRKSYNMAFEHFYGNPANYCILALLPSYLEREGSSLIYMVNDLIGKSNHPKSGFFLNDFDKLRFELKQLEASGTKTLLIGVSFALLDFAEEFQFDLKNTIIMETGGMKGRRKEMIRAELHHQLKKGFGVEAIHSEYGMTELLSQAYSFGNGIFNCPHWMKIMIRDTEDALTMNPTGKTGGINVIDLANINSCSFIATQDLGKVFENGSFEVLGRFDHSDIRGCNLMAL